VFRARKGGGDDVADPAVSRFVRGRGGDDHSYEEGWWRCGRPLCLTKHEKRGGRDMVLVTVDPSVSRFVRGRGEEVRRSDFLCVNY